MYTEDAISIYRRFVVVFGRVLYLGTIDNLCVFVWGVLWLPGVGVVVLQSKVGNVVIHGEADCALGVNGVAVLLTINAGVQLSLPVLIDFVMFFEDLLEVYGVLFANVFNAEVINYHAKNDWAPSVAPDPRCEGTLLVFLDHEALF